MRKFFGLKAKAYSYLIDYGSEDKKAKCIKKESKQNKTWKLWELFRSNSAWE